MLNTELKFEPFATEIRTDPYPHYRELRENAPVYWAQEAKLWVVSRYHDVRHIMKHPERFSSDAMGTLLTGKPTAPADPGDTRILILLDPPRHGPLRDLLNRGFTPRRIQRLEARLREIVDEAMVEVVAKVSLGQSFDLVSHISVPVPVTVIAELLGVARSRQSDFKRWSDDIIAGSTGSARAEGESARFAEGMGNLKAYMAELIEERRREPREDLVSALTLRGAGVASCDALSDSPNEALSEHEIVMFAVLLLVAGNETTTNLIGNAVRALLEHPDQLERVRRDRSLVPNMIEEVLRYDAPVQFLFRRTREPVEVAGVPLPENAPLLLLVGSANRDERRFENADAFDIGREPRGHLAFGFGVHFCLGASLARLEARVCLEALLDELPELCVCGGPIENIDSSMMRGPRRLELTRIASLECAS